MGETLQNVLKILKHLAIIIAIILAIVLGFFYMYLPVITNHGDSITVPDLEGQDVRELDEMLSSKKLRYEVEPDSGYSATYPALAVLKQFPLPNSKVKENRKIYITLNAKKPPVIRVPDLYGLSLKDAMLQLNSLGLAVGNTEYVPELHINTVLEWSYKGKKMEVNEEVPKGSKIDFVLADGAGNQKFPVPNLVGQEFEDGRVALLGMGLKVGNLFFEKEGKIEVETTDELGNTEMKEIEIAPGYIFKQKPANTKGSIKIGETVDLWVVERDTLDHFEIPDLELPDEEKKED
ncbi:MAG: PASTA domain-containing protein [Cyclobacteriaceae bacterium]